MTDEQINKVAEEYSHRRFNTKLLYDMYGFQSKKDFIEGATYALTHQWISADEAMPPLEDECGLSVSIDVVVKFELGAVTTAWYDYDRNEWHLMVGGNVCGDDLIEDKVTHWMPIPKIGGEERATTMGRL